MHKNREDVKPHLIDAKLDSNFFAEKRIEGIKKYNMDILSRKNFDKSKLMRERKSRKAGDVKMCTGCHKFIASATFYRHLCRSSPNPVRTSTLLPLLHHDNEFKERVLDKFQEDEAGMLCRQNALLKQMGYRIFNKKRHSISKAAECRKNSMTEMRQLANLFLEYKKVPGAPADAKIEDMFRKGGEATAVLYEAIRRRGLRTTTEKTKHGLLKNIKSVIRRSAKHLEAIYDEQNNDEKVADVQGFRRQFLFRDPEVFAEAEHLALERVFQRRRPSELPDNDNIAKLHKFIKEHMVSLCDNFSLRDYAFLRNITVCRLTLYNARRGEEAARMMITEYEDAIKKVWCSDMEIEAVEDEAEQYLAGQFLLAYLHGKGKKFVPVLIPKDATEALDILLRFRESYGIKEKNKFLFASKGSYNHCSGWNAIKSVTNE